MSILQYWPCGSGICPFLDLQLVLFPLSRTQGSKFPSETISIFWVTTVIQLVLSSQTQCRATVRVHVLSIQRQLRHPNRRGIYLYLTYQSYRTVSIRHSKVAGALHSPNGIIVNCRNPNPVINAVASLSRGLTFTCQYLLFKSNVQNHLAPWNIADIHARQWVTIIPGYFIELPIIHTKSGCTILLRY